MHLESLLCQGHGFHSHIHKALMLSIRVSDQINFCFDPSWQCYVMVFFYYQVTNACSNTYMYSDIQWSSTIVMTGWCCVHFHHFAFIICMVIVVCFYFSIPYLRKGEFQNINLHQMLKTAKDTVLSYLILFCLVVLCKGNQTIKQTINCQIITKTSWWNT